MLQFQANIIKTTCDLIKVKRDPSSTGIVPDIRDIIVTLESKADEEVKIVLVP